MAGKTYLAGEAAVRLTPNSAQFHHTARREIAAKPLNAGVSLVADAKGFRTDAREKLKSGPKLTHPVKLTADLTGFKTDAKAKLDAIKLEVRAGVKFENTAAEVQRLKQELAREKLTVRVKVEFDTDGYAAKLAAMTRPRTQEIRVRVDRSGIDQLQGSLEGVTSTVTSTTNNITNMGRSGSRALLPLVVGMVALGAVSLIPLIGQLSQALGVIALLPAAAGAALGAIAALAVGFTGIGKAFTAKAPKATDTSGDTNRMAAAQRSMAAAERGLANAQKQSVAAQKKLNDERKMAVRRLRDMNDELDMSVMNEEDAQIAVLRAREALQETYATGGSALDIREAQNNIRTAEEAADQVIKKNQDLRSDVEAANKAGVEGDAGVVAAKEGVVDALDAVTAAQEGVASAAEQMATANSSGTAAVNELADALNNLSPNARAFVETVRGLGDEWRALRMEVQDSLFANLGDDVSVLATNYLPLLQTGLSGIADSINGGIRRALEDLNSNAAMENFRTILENTRLAMGPLIDGLSDLGFALGNIASVGSGFLPGIAQNFADTMERFKNWTADPENQDKIRAFIEESMRTLDQVWEFAKALGRTISGLFGTSDEAGETMLKSMTDTLNGWADWMNTADGQERMKAFWEDVRQTITDIFNMIGLAIKLADKIGRILGIDEGTVETPNGEITPTREGTSRTALGKDYVNERGEAVNGKGEGVFRGPGPLPDIRKSSPLGKLMGRFDQDSAPVVDDPFGLNIRRGGIGALGAVGSWIGGLFGDDEEGRRTSGGSFGPATDPNGIPLGTGSNRGRNRSGRAGGAMPGPTEEDLSLWDRFSEKVSGVKTTLIGDDGVTGWTGQVGGAFDGLGTKVDSAKTWITEKVSGIGTGILNWKNDSGEWLGNIGGFFGDLGTKIGEVFTDIIDQKFPWMRDALDGVTGWFSSTLASISGIWSGLKAAAADPINWVIDKVINGALKNAWNAVAKVIPGLSEWGGVERMEVATGGSPAQNTPGGGDNRTEFHTGGVFGDPSGVIPGYALNRDTTTIAVGGGEAIMRPEVTAAMGHDSINELNATAKRSGVAGVRDALDKRMAHFAGGGIVDSLTRIVSAKFPGMSMTSGLRFTDDGYHSKGMAADFSNGGTEGSPEMKSLAGFIADNYAPQTIELIHTPFDRNIGAGGAVGDGYGFYGAGTMADHRDHVHWAATEALGEPTGGVISTVKSAIGSVVNSARNAAASAFESAAGRVGESIPDFGGSLIGGIPRAAFDGIKGAMSEAIRGQQATAGGGGAGPDALWQPSGGAEQWRQMMIDAYKNQGYDPTPAKIDAWVRQIDSESGGDPNIAQGIVDVNGTGEAAGVGLGQMIPTTWQAYRDPTLPDNRRDPWAMTNAMVRYGEQKFGDGLLDMIGHGHGYDQGGVANGVGVMPKYTIEPERVLDPAQTRAFEQLIPLLKFILPNLQTTGTTDPIPVKVADTGMLNGQPLQGATIGPEGEYIPAPGPGNASGGVSTATAPAAIASPPVAFSTTPGGKAAMSLAGTFGFGAQANYLQSKEAPLMELTSGITAAAAAAAAGPQAFAAHQAQTAAAAAASIGQNFADYVPTAIGGMAESALSALAGPLIGTVNTGMSKSEVTSAIGDATNRAMRRTKSGRQRR